MKKKLLLLAAAVCALSLQAQEDRVAWAAGVITEGQWNMTDGKTGWANRISADLGVRLWKGALFDVSTLTTYSTGTPVADDRQGFSNIDVENRAFRLFHAGLSQTFLNESLTLFVGLKAADEDYFNTDLAGLFTGSSYGGIPVCTENHGISVYPEAALALHAEYVTGGWTLRESFYNGAPSDRLDEQFRFRPGRDGLFNIGSAMYAVETEGYAFTSYTLGYAFSTKKVTGQTEFGLWGGVEQPVYTWGKMRLNLLAEGAAELTKNAACKGYWAAGAVAENITRNGGQLGLAVNRVYCQDGHETDVELTFLCPLGAGFSLQPALHAIRTDGVTTMAGQFRLCYEIGSK
ncbi:MAG: porin [Bacteroidaceae bacterium]|nr:porin [Bacteroidaceae bacterium]